MKLLNSLSLLSLSVACLSQPLDEPAANDGGFSLSKRHETEGWIGQFSNLDCSHFPVTKGEEWHNVICPNSDIDPKNYCIKGARPKLTPHSCIPWYPVLTADKGPSLGVTFGAGGEKLTKIKFYKSAGPCIHDLSNRDSSNGNLPNCCDDTQGNFLGALFDQGKSDFGASYHKGLDHGVCATIGSQVGANQTIWQTRFVAGSKETD